jgi:uncharacterized protein YraI
MKRKIIAAAAAVAASACIFALPVRAADGWSAARVHLRTGPDTHYPVVAVVPSGAGLLINGCLNAWTWCDVSWGGARGWMAGRYIQTAYNHRRAYIADSGPYAHVPVVVYRDARRHDPRFEPQRDRWMNRHGNGGRGWRYDGRGGWSHPSPRWQGHYND